MNTHLPAIKKDYSSSFFYINLFIYFWLCWVFVSVRGLSPVVESWGHSSSRCAGLSLSRPLVAEHSSRRASSVVVAHGLSCSMACGIFPDQGSNPCPLHRQADSQPLHHQGSPLSSVLTNDNWMKVLYAWKAREQIIWDNAVTWLWREDWMEGC